MKWKPIPPSNAVILIVEDNLNNFILMTRLLAFLGVKKCEWKASGWKVLEFAETLGNIDLILMDIALPDADGFESLVSLRSHPRFKSADCVTADGCRMWPEHVKPVSMVSSANLGPRSIPEQACLAG